MISQAHDQSFQKYADKHKLCFGAQWRIARLISLGRDYGQIDVDCPRRLEGQTNASAATRAVDVALGLEEIKAPEPSQFGAAVEDEIASKVL